MPGGKRAKLFKYEHKTGMKTKSVNLFVKPSKSALNSYLNQLFRDYQQLMNDAYYAR